ncbi:uncharacterized protein isoform X3 [Musca autumnalis]|uniref:uncharacterized protein isoform X3 n=1 Tax=Musca autumnalis TaxID=221902 RepID=UPI003CEB5C7F
MVKCILCLEYPTIPGPKFLDIFSEEGLRLGISAIINKHFWIKTYRNGGGGEKQQVCMTCWEVVRDFHILYERVEEAHKHLGNVSTIDILDDPLPHQDVVMLKSEDTPVPMMLPDPIMGHSSMGNNIFDPEVKVEVNDLDLLPQIEILETGHDISMGGDGVGGVTDEDVKTRRTRNAPASPKTTAGAKRIKKESSPTLDNDYDDDDVDVFGDSAPQVAYSSDEDSDKPLLPPSLNVTQEEEDNKEKGVTRPRRGRPRKSEAEKAAAKTTTSSAKKTPVARKRNSKKSVASTIKNEGDESEEPSCSTSAAAAAAATTHIKTEGETTEDQQNKPSTADASGAGEGFDIPDFTNENEDDDDDPEYGDNDNDFVAKDSDDSSNSESEEENDSDASDWADKGKSEKFAVILKKERNTPKKYKKREKTAGEPKKMSKEDIAARQAQQAEYDNIITKFFEKLRCPKCELMVHTFSDMRAHFRLDHNDDHGFVECCGRRFATRKFLAEHIMVHYNPEHFKCKTCNKICRDSTQLEAHEQTHLPNPPEAKYKKTFQCEKCSKTFSSKASFEHHMVAKHVPREEFKFECPECKKKFSCENSLTEHQNNEHSSTLQDFVCDICGKSLPKLIALNVHKRKVHNPKKPAQCKYCGKWLATRASMNEHVFNMHLAADKEHRCDICGHCSTSPSALYQHKRLKHKLSSVDNCERKYKCTLCEKAYKTSMNLKEHMTSHTGIKIFKCEYCESSFRHYSALFNHRKSFHPLEYSRMIRRTVPDALKELEQQMDEDNGGGGDDVNVKNEVIDDEDVKRRYEPNVLKESELKLDYNDDGGVGVKVKTEPLDDDGLMEFVLPDGANDDYNFQA